MLCPPRRRRISPEHYLNEGYYLSITYGYYLWVLPMSITYEYYL